LGKVRPGQKAIPLIVEFKGMLYLARNLDLSSPNGTNNGGKLYKCSSACQTTGNWSEVFDIRDAGFVNGSKGGNNNLAISLLQVNGNYLYLGFDNATDGAGIFRSNLDVTDITAPSNFSIQGGDYGLGEAAPKKYIFSSASALKQGVNYVYITVGNTANSVRVMTQRD
jgi:hypothetical protein